VKKVGDGGIFVFDTDDVHGTSLEYSTYDVLRFQRDTNLPLRKAFHAHPLA
jgi:hypothetical protein